MPSYHQKTLILERFNNFSKGLKLVSVGELEFEHRCVLLWSLSSVLYCLPKWFRSLDRGLEAFEQFFSFSFPPKEFLFVSLFPLAKKKGWGWGEAD